MVTQVIAAHQDIPVIVVHQGFLVTLDNLVLVVLVAIAGLAVGQDNPALVV